MNLVLILKNGICVRICSKFSVKSEASHKNIKSRLFNAIRLQEGTAQSIRTNIITNHHFFFCIKERVPAEPGVDKPHFSVLCTSPVEQYSFNACCLQIGRVGTYRQVLHLTITVCRKLQDKVYSY